MTDAEIRDAMLPLRIIRRLMATVFDPSNPTHPPAIAELNAVEATQLMRLSVKHPMAMLRRLDRDCAALLDMFANHKMPAVIGAVTTMLNRLTDEGKIAVDYDKDGYRVLADLVACVDDVTDQLIPGTAAARLHAGLLRSGDTLAGLLYDRAMVLGYWRKRAKVAV